MSPEEMSRYIQFLFEQIQQKDAQHKELLEQLAGIKEELKRANETISSNTSEQQRLSTLVMSLTNQLHEAQQTITELVRKNEDLQSSARVSKKHRLGMSSEEMGRFVIHLMEQLDAIREELRVSNAEQQRLNALVLSLTEQLHESHQSIADKERIIEELKSSVRASKKQRFVS